MMGRKKDCGVVSKRSKDARSDGSVIPIFCLNLIGLFHYSIMLIGLQDQNGKGSNIQVLYCYQQ